MKVMQTQAGRFQTWGSKFNSVTIKYKLWNNIYSSVYRGADNIVDAL